MFIWLGAQIVNLVLELFNSWQAGISQVWNAKGRTRTECVNVFVESCEVLHLCSQPRRSFSLWNDCKELSANSREYSIFWRSMTSYIIWTSWIGNHDFTVVCYLFHYVSQFSNPDNNQFSLFFLSDLISHRINKTSYSFDK